MGLKNNNGYINLKSEDKKGYYDLEVMVRDKDVIGVKTDIRGFDGYRYDLNFTIAEIEALYNFAQILKNN